MDPLLAKLGADVIGQILKKVLKAALSWAENRHEPTSDIVELKLSQIAEKVLADAIPAEHRPAAASSVVNLVLPTYEQVVEYSPTAQKIIAAMKKAPAKKAAARKAPAKKAAAKKAPAKKAARR